MSKYRSEGGPIPDETFENDSGSPDPELLAMRDPKEFDDRLVAMLTQRARNARRATNERDNEL